MKLNIFLLLFGICLGIIGYNKFLDSPDKEVLKYINKIDTIYNERQIYKKDTVIVKQKIVIDHFDTVVKNIDSVFNSNNDSLKQKLFDFTFPTTLYDSFKIIDATNSQAKSAIEYRNLFTRDSSLLNICQENVKNCDESLDKVKTQTDSLKLIKPKNNFWKGFGVGVGTGVSIFGLTYILLAE